MLSFYQTYVIGLHNFVRRLADPDEFLIIVGRPRSQPLLGVIRNTFRINHNGDEVDIYHTFSVVGWISGVICHITELDDGSVILTRKMNVLNGETHSDFKIR